MLEVSLIDDILEYEENVFIGMTFRQTVLSFAGVGIIAGSYFLTTYANMNSQIASYVAMGLGLPCFLFAFLRPHKMKLEKYISVWLRFHFLSRKTRVWQTDNLFYRLLWQGQKPVTKVDVLLHEYDTENKKGIEGVVVSVFKIEKEKGKKIEIPVCRTVTDADGVVQLANLTVGRYKWVEEITPMGYFDARTKPMYFEVRENGKMKGTLGMTNKPYREKQKKESKPKVQKPQKQKIKQQPIHGAVEVKNDNGQVIGVMINGQFYPAAKTNDKEDN